MGFWEIFAVGLAALLIHKGVEAAEQEKAETEYRRSFDIDWSEGITEEQFTYVVKKCAKKWKRRITSLSIEDAIVYGTLESRQGLNEYDFSLDFNDYGHITGKYWSWRENTDQTVPITLADNISYCVQLLKSHNKNEEAENYTNTYQDTYTDNAATEDDDATSNFEYYKNFARNLRYGPFDSRIKSKSGFFTHLWWMITGKKSSTGLSTYSYKSMYCNEVIKRLCDNDFYKIDTSPVEDLTFQERTNKGLVDSVFINNEWNFNEDTMFPVGSQIQIVYHALKKQEPPFTSRQAHRMNDNEVAQRFSDVGFGDVEIKPIFDLTTGWIVKNFSVDKISINGDRGYKKKKYDVDSKIRITYHTFSK